MTYLLDSNIIIAMLKGREDGRRAAQRLASLPPGEVAVCAIVEAELWHGAEKYQMPEKRRQDLAGILAPHPSLPFDSRCASQYAHIRHALEQAGQLIGGNDLLIASIALAHQLTLVTHNSGEFRRVPGLMVEDWL